MRLCAFLACLVVALPAVGATPDERFPRIDPAQRLEGKALVTALRAGGYVLYMRHAKQTAPQPEACSPANLTPEGQQQAARVGERMRALAIPIGAIHASTFCRASITASLMQVGRVDETPDLLPGIEPAIQAARRRLLSQPPAAGTNTLLVSHVQGGESEADRMQLELAEIIVYRPDGRGAAAPVARIAPEDWAALE